MLNFNTSKYARQEYNAKMNNANLDTIFSIKQPNIKHSLNHIDDCINNPTIGLLARKKYETHYAPLIAYKQNLKDLLSEYRVKEASDNFKYSYNKMYPKTGNIRKFLINNNNVQLDNINPINKSLKRKFFNVISKIL